MHRPVPAAGRGSLFWCGRRLPICDSIFHVSKNNVRMQRSDAAAHPSRRDCGTFCRRLCWRYSPPLPSTLRAISNPSPQQLPGPRPYGSAGMHPGHSVEAWPRRTSRAAATEGLSAADPRTKPGSQHSRQMMLRRRTPSPWTVSSRRHRGPRSQSVRPSFTEYGPTGVLCHPRDLVERHVYLQATTEPAIVSR